MTKPFLHLGPFSDLVAAADRTHRLFPLAKPGRKTQRLFRESLAFFPRPEKPLDVKIGRRWTRDGVDGEVISWSVGYGPRTGAWLLRPAGEKGKLPGVLALHDHGGYKFYGKEKITRGPGKLEPFRQNAFNTYYGGHDYPSDLARAGFAVLVHDTFTWGSRKLPWATIPEADRQVGQLLARHAPPRKGLPARISLYNCGTMTNEHTLAKYCNVMGISLPGIVSFEDRIAVNYLAGRRDVDATRIGCLGLSGGGTRTVLLQGSCDQIRCAVAVGAMCTYRGMLDHNIGCHTWMLFPPAWGRHGDWADIAACRAPSPLMILNDIHDALYTLDGMKESDRRIRAHYRSVGKPERYRCEFHPGPHKFDAKMQNSALKWLKKWLQAV